MLTKLSVALRREANANHSTVMPGLDGAMRSGPTALLLAALGRWRQAEVEITGFQRVLVIA